MFFSQTENECLGCSFVTLFNATVKLIQQVILFRVSSSPLRTLLFSQIARDLEALFSCYMDSCLIMNYLRFTYTNMNIFQTILALKAVWANSEKCHRLNVMDLKEEIIMSLLKHHDNLF